MSEQLLSAEGGIWNITSQPPSLSVSLWLRETDGKIRGSDDAKVLKQHKDCLQACHKGILGSGAFSASRCFLLRHTIFRFMLWSLLLKC